MAVLLTLSCNWLSGVTWCTCTLERRARTGLYQHVTKRHSSYWLVASYSAATKLRIRKHYAVQRPAVSLLALRMRWFTTYPFKIPDFRQISTRSSDSWLTTNKLDKLACCLLLKIKDDHCFIRKSEHTKLSPDSAQGSLARVRTAVASIIP